MRLGRTRGSRSLSRRRERRSLCGGGHPNRWPSSILGPGRRTCRTSRVRDHARVLHQPGSLPSHHPAHAGVGGQSTASHSPRLALAVGCLVASRVSFLGNYFTAAGSYKNETVVDTQPAVIPGPLFLLARLVGASAVMVAALLIAKSTITNPALPLLRRRDTRRGLVSAAAGAPAAATALVFASSLSALYAVVIAATHAPFFDRYLIVLVPFVAGLLTLAGLRYDVLCCRVRRWPRAPDWCSLPRSASCSSTPPRTIDEREVARGESSGERRLRAPERSRRLRGFGFHQPDDVTLSSSRSGESLGTRIFSPRPSVQPSC